MTKDLINVSGLPYDYPHLVADPRSPPGPSSLLGHDELGAVDEHRDELWSWVALEDKPRYAPFEVPQATVWTLVTTGFWKYMNPSIAVRGVSGGCEHLIVAIGREDQGLNNSWGGR